MTGWFSTLFSSKPLVYYLAVNYLFFALVYAQDCFETCSDTAARSAGCSPNDTACLCQHLEEYQIEMSVCSSLHCDPQDQAKTIELICTDRTTTSATSSSSPTSESETTLSSVSSSILSTLNPGSSGWSQSSASSLASPSSRPSSGLISTLSSSASSTSSPSSSVAPRPVSSSSAQLNTPLPTRTLSIDDQTQTNSTTRGITITTTEIKMPQTTAHESRTSLGTIIGIIIAIFIFVTIVILLCYYRKRQRNHGLDSLISPYPYMAPETGTSWNPSENEAKMAITQPHAQVHSDQERPDSRNIDEMINDHDEQSKYFRRSRASLATTTAETLVEGS